MDKFRESRQKKRSLQQQPQTFQQSYSEQKIIKQQNLDDDQNLFPTTRFNESGFSKGPSNQRRYQQVQQKLKEKQIAYRHLYDLHDKTSKQKQLIEASLNLQIQKYKLLIKQIQDKAEVRLRQVQKLFKDEMQRRIQQKQLQLKHMLDENGQLKQVVNQLQQIGNKLESELNCTKNDLKNTEINLKKTDQQKKAYMQKLEAAEQHSKAQAQKFQSAIDDLKEKAIYIQRQWRDKLDQAGKQRQKALKVQQKQLRQQIRRIQQKFQAQKNDRKQELKDMMKSFEQQKDRLNQLIAEKQRSMQQLHKQSKQTTQRLNCVIRGYEQQIQSLATQKTRLFQQVDSLNSQNTHLNVLVKQLQLNSANQKKNLQSYILKLKDDINYGQVNFLRQRDRNVMNFQDSSKQIVTLKKQLSALQLQYQKVKFQCSDSNVLANQVRQLRDLLMQSSFELQKCKGQFVRISKQRDMLALKLNQSIYQVSNSTRRGKLQGWQGPRDAYYLNRSRSIRR